MSSRKEPCAVSLCSHSTFGLIFSVFVPLAMQRSSLNNILTAWQRDRMYDCTTNKKVDIDIVVSGFCSSHNVNHGSQSVLGCSSCMENCLSNRAEKHLTAFFACKYILLKG